MLSTMEVKLPAMRRPCAYSSSWACCLAYEYVSTDLRTVQDCLFGNPESLTQQMGLVNGKIPAQLDTQAVKVHAAEQGKDWSAPSTSKRAIVL